MDFMQSIGLFAAQTFFNSFRYLGRDHCHRHHRFSGYGPQRRNPSGAFTQRNTKTSALFLNHKL